MTKFVIFSMTNFVHGRSDEPADDRNSLKLTIRVSAGSVKNRAVLIN
jgi:hypothetical protein